MARPLRIFPVSLGCVKNEADLELALTRLTDAGHALAASLRMADVALVNTCAFTDDARRESRAAINDLERAADRGVTVVVMGCLVQHARQRLLADFPWVAAAVGPGSVAQLPAVLARARAGARPLLCGGLHKPPAGQPTVKLTPRHYSYLRIAEGCDNRCHYCIIPDLRGGLRSRLPREIISEARRRLAEGARELILAAQDTANYGTDLAPRGSLPELLTELAALDGEFWLRVLYAHPAHVTDELLAVMARETKIVKYLDMPLQHSHPAVVKAMGRPALDALALVRRVRAAVPGIALRTTLMVGFPGEGEEEFAALTEFVRAARFERLGLFAFQPQPGTPAFNRTGHLDPELKEQRRQTLWRLQEETSEERNRALVGQTLTVLVDAREGDRFRARTVADAPEIDQTVTVRGTCRVGVFTQVTVTGAEAFALQARVTGRTAPRTDKKQSARMPAGRRARS
ncbi:MAG TPA: 30S ribosomal protein S12 methylthiotransferase RimO [bacterium]|nr:30S ribosomal protein S12 methylthiotransferase RimO [bacterium]